LKSATRLRFCSATSLPASQAKSSTVTPAQTLQHKIKTGSAPDNGCAAGFLHVWRLAGAGCSLCMRLSAKWGVVRPIEMKYQSNAASRTPGRRINPSNESSRTPGRRVNPSNESSRTPGRRVNPSNESSRTPERRVNPSNESSRTPGRRVNPLMSHPAPRDDALTPLMSHPAPRDDALLFKSKNRNHRIAVSSFKI